MLEKHVVVGSLPLGLKLPPSWALDTGLLGSVPAGTALNRPTEAAWTLQHEVREAMLPYLRRPPAASLAPQDTEMVVSVPLYHGTETGDRIGPSFPLS